MIHNIEALLRKYQLVLLISEGLFEIETDQLQKKILKKEIIQTTMVIEDIGRLLN